MPLQLCAKAVTFLLLLFLPSFGSYNWQQASVNCMWIRTQINTCESLHIMVYPFHATSLHTCTMKMSLFLHIFTCLWVQVGLCISLIYTTNLWWYTMVHLWYATVLYQFNCYGTGPTVTSEQPCPPHNIPTFQLCYAAATKSTPPSQIQALFSDSSLGFCCTSDFAGAGSNRAFCALEAYPHVREQTSHCPEKISRTSSPHDAARGILAWLHLQGGRGSIGLGCDILY